MKRLIVLSALMALTAPAVATAGENGCTCRSSDGRDVLEGQTACIRSPNGMVMARCEKVLNNTSWRFLDRPCPSAGMSVGRPLSLPTVNG